MSSEEDILALNDFLENEDDNNKQIKKSRVDSKIYDKDEKSTNKKEIKPIKIQENTINQNDKKQTNEIKEENQQMYNPPSQTQMNEENSNETKELIVYVAYLNNNVTEEIIQKYFDKFGKINSIDIRSKNINNENKNYAFVKYQKIEDGNKAILEMNEKEIEELGKTKLIVKAATNQNQQNKKNIKKKEMNKNETKYSNDFNSFQNMQNYQQFYYPNPMTNSNTNVPPSNSNLQNNSMNQNNPLNNSNIQKQQMYNPNISNQFPPNMFGIPFWPDPYFFQQHEKQKATLYIAHLPQNANELFLYRNFSKFGAIETCNCLYEPSTKLCKGVGFITFLDSNDAYKAMQVMNNKVFEGQPIKVKFKNQK